VITFKLLLASPGSVGPLCTILFINGFFFAPDHFLSDSGFRALLHTVLSTFTRQVIVPSRFDHLAIKFRAAFKLDIGYLRSLASV